MEWHNAISLFSWCLSHFFFCPHFYCRFNLLFWVNSNWAASREADIHQVVVDLGWNELMVSHGHLACSLPWIRPHFNFLLSSLPWILISDWNWKADLTFITGVCRLSGPCHIQENVAPLNRRKLKLDKVGHKMKNLLNQSHSLGDTCLLEFWLLEILWHCSALTTMLAPGSKVLFLLLCPLVLFDMLKTSWNYQNDIASTHGPLKTDVNTKFTRTVIIYLAN